MSDIRLMALALLFIGINQVFHYFEMKKLERSCNILKELEITLIDDIEIGDD